MDTRFVKESPVVGDLCSSSRSSHEYDIPEPCANENPYAISDTFAIPLKGPQLKLPIAKPNYDHIPQLNHELVNHYEYFVCMHATYSFTVKGLHYL